MAGTADRGFEHIKVPQATTTAPAPAAPPLPDLPPVGMNVDDEPALG
jgi:hypothetical protein